MEDTKKETTENIDMTNSNPKPLPDNDQATSSNIVPSNSQIMSDNTTSDVNTTKSPKPLEDNTVETPSLSNAYTDKSKPGITFGVLGILLSAIPLAGAALGVYSIIKGFFKKPKNPVLGILGIVAICLSVFFTLITLIWAGNTMIYEELNTYQGTTESPNYSFSYPVQMKQKNTTSENTKILLQHTGKLFGQPFVYSFISLSSRDMDFDINQLDAAVDMMSTDEYNQQIKQSYEKNTEDGLSIDGVEVTATERSLVSGYPSISKDITYTVSSSGKEVTGKTTFIFDTDNYKTYIFSMFAESSIWDTSGDIWDQILKSVRIVTQR